MILVTYRDKGFEFLGLRFEERNGFNLISEGGGLHFNDIHEVETFLDYYEAIGVNYYKMKLNRADYGKTMSFYEDLDLGEIGDTVVWYKKKYIVIKRKSVANVYLTLKRIVKKWTQHAKHIKKGDYRNLQTFEYRQYTTYK